ncbi:Proline-Rich Protein 23D2 [Manis pentadactyla]|nr:Proline-Rich Protein 23D2 [Manis pentadactyla]
MDRRRRPRSPSEPQTERKAANAAQSRWAATQQNPASCRWTEQQPRAGAQAAAVHPTWSPDPPVALDPTQGQHIPGTPGMIVVVLEPGTDLELRLGDEVLVLAPQAALQLTLPDLVVVVVPAQLLRVKHSVKFCYEISIQRGLSQQTDEIGDFVVV